MEKQILIEFKHNLSRTNFNPNVLYCLKTVVVLDPRSRVVILAQVRPETRATSTVTSPLYFQTVKGDGSLPRHAAVSPRTFSSLNHLNPFKSSGSTPCRSQTESQTCPRLLLHFAQRHSGGRRGPNTR